MFSFAHFIVIEFSTILLNLKVRKFSCEFPTFLAESRFTNFYLIGNNPVFFDANLF